MKFLCKLFGCESSKETVVKEVIKEVPVEVVKEVIKEVPVEVIKEVQADIYPQKPDRPNVSGSLKEQLTQIYDHYGYECPSDARISRLAQEIDDSYIELLLDLIDVINDKTIKYMNRPAFSEEVTPILFTHQSERATHHQVLQNKIKIAKERSRASYINDAIRYDYPICGCQVHNQ